jgi:hypothetical protein
VTSTLSESEKRDAAARQAAVADALRPGATVLEIGPLDRPMLSKDVYDVRYADHASADELRTKYHGDPNLREIVDVDVVWNGVSPLVDVADGVVFDGVVASHVVEHIPDPVGWLTNIGTAMKVGGAVFLVVPDKRFTFDHNRRLTETSDLVDAYVRRLTLPTSAQLYDFHTKALPVVAADIWAGRVNYAGQVRPGNLREEALDACRTLESTRAFADVHCHTFTPEQFVGVFSDLTELGVLPFAITDLVPTERDTIEFYVRLEYLGPSGSAPTHQREKLTALVAAGPQVDTPTAGEAFALSPREERLVGIKRHAAAIVRRGARRARSTLRR